VRDKPETSLALAHLIRRGIPVDWGGQGIDGILKQSLASINFKLG
jgi:hypothetical protein